MAQLTTVQDYVTEARRLLLDEYNGSYRYPDTDIIDAINLALMEARRVRPDLFIGRASAVPSYSSLSDTVVIDLMYRSAILYYVVGHMQLRDSEDTTDARATVFLNKFVAQMLTIQS